MFKVCIFADDELIFEGSAYRGSLANVLRLAAKEVTGIPSAWCGIRYNGRRLAELETNWRGEMKEVSILAESKPEGLCYGVIKVTPMNPACFVS